MKEKDEEFEPKNGTLSLFLSLYEWKNLTSSLFMHFQYLTVQKRIGGRILFWMMMIHFYKTSSLPFFSFLLFLFPFQCFRTHFLCTFSPTFSFFFRSYFSISFSHPFLFGVCSSSAWFSFLHLIFHGFPFLPSSSPHHTLSKPYRVDVTLNRRFKPIFSPILFSSHSPLPFWEDFFHHLSLIFRFQRLS